MFSTNYILRIPRLMLAVVWKYIGRLFSDLVYLKVAFRLHMGKRLNLTNPQTFSEKMQWLKLYDHNPEYTKMVDKYAAKEYVAERIGEEYIIPTIGVWDKTEDIDWNSLPKQFVLKCTHDSGGLVICRDKDTLNRKAAEKKLNKCLKRDYYKIWREWPYKNVPHRIIAENYIEPDPEINDLPDYKFFCFNGEPKYCQVITGRNETMSIDFFDSEWNHQPFHEPHNYPFAKQMPVKPAHFDLMINLARRLAENKSFSRIDFYQVRDQVLFGEITFYPTTGMGGFDPEEYDMAFGKMIQLPSQNQ